MAGWLLLTGGLALFALLRRGPQRPVLASLLVALAIGTPIAARVGGLAEALSVLGLVAAYDAAAYVVGTGADNRWEGPAAGIATVFAAALLVAALAVPPFALVTVGLMAIVVAIAGPLGPTMARWIAEVPARHHGPEDDEAGAPEEAPAVRRISTLLAAAPALLALLAYTAAVR
ncbi:MAG: hypothetical protein Q8K63_07990 [Acidimicrobiales bacterium]|nr:hypothetical protein [Acidimicrobiales bacterium]